MVWWFKVRERGTVCADRCYRHPCQRTVTIATKEILQSHLVVPCDSNHAQVMMLATLLHSTNSASFNLISRILAWNTQGFYVSTPNETIKCLQTFLSQCYETTNRCVALTAQHAQSTIKLTPNFKNGFWKTSSGNVIEFGARACASAWSSASLGSLIMCMGTLASVSPRK